MTEHRASKRYATSLLELAKEQKVLDAIRDDMNLFLEVCEVSSPFRAVLKNPEIQGDKKLNVLEALFAAKVNKITMSFFQIVVRKRREPFLLPIAEEFLHLYNVDQNIQETHITTTFKISDDLRAEFEKVAREISGMRPEINEHVDKDIVGGFILRVDDRQIDSSIRSKLNELKLKLTN